MADVGFPLLLTWLRIGLIPVFVLVFYLPFSWSGKVCAAVFVIAALTDWLDGLLARRMGQSSNFGAFLDPVADKLIVAVALVLLVEAHPSPWLALPAAIIIGREIVVSALREWMAEIGKRAHVAVSIMGKIKAIAQMTAIPLLLYEAPLGPVPTFWLGVLLLYGAVGLTLWSMVIYLKIAWPMLHAPQEEAHDQDYW